jgi:sugar lactone lactonase YvrE
VRVRRWWRSTGLLLVLICGGLAWWYWPRPAPPAPDWRAVVTVLAGNGLPGTVDGPPDDARFADPFGVAAGADGRVYVTDTGDISGIRVVSSEGVQTLTGGAPGFVDGPGRTARFDGPSGLAVGPDDTIYVADTANNAIRTVTADGAVTTLAGDGLPGHRDGAGATARFNGPIGIAVDARGHVFVADTYNDCIREVAPDGRVRTVAGTGEPGWADGAAATALFDTPTGLAFDRQGRLLIADTGNGQVRMLDSAGRVSTLATGPVHLSRPLSVAADDEGTTYVSDEQGRVVAVPADGRARVLAGGPAGFADGFGASAAFRRPAGLVVLGPRRLVVADAGNRLLRLLRAPGSREWRAPAPPGRPPRFDPGPFAQVPLLWPVAPLEGPHEIAGTHGERRGADGEERFHTGVDVRVPQGTPVHVVRSGRVVSPLANGAVDSLNEWVRVGDVTYVHLRVGRERGAPVLDTERFAATYEADGSLRRLRVKRGATFDAGAIIGSVNAFNHVHLGVGWPGDEHNPLDLRLLRFSDSIPPTIAAGGVQLTTEHGQPLTMRARGRLLVSGRARIVVDAWDQADGNVPWRRLGLYTAGYQVLHTDGTPAPGFERPRITLRFDRLGASADAPRLIYAPGSGIPVYGNARTRFLYVVTNRLAGGVASVDYWDTRTLPPGDYTLRIHAADQAGNVALARRDVPVTVLGW